MNNTWSGGQYSAFRALFGLYLLVHFVHLLPWATEVFSSQGMLPDAGLSPLARLFPNILTLADSPAFVLGFICSGALAAVAFAVGYRDRWAALWMWYVLACLFGRNPLIANPSLPYVGWMLLAHLFVPAAPYGSWAARGRVDPAGTWTMPRHIVLAGWVVLALSYSYSGYTKLLSPSWVAGDTVRHVLENPLARDYFLRDLFLALPPVLLKGITVAILWIEFLFAPLALSARLRPYLWSAMLVVQFGFAFLLNFADLTLAMLLFHFFTFDPDWLKGRGGAEVEYVFYDGHCGLCHRVIRFLLAEDHGHRFRYAPLQGAAFASAVPPETRTSLPDSFVVLTSSGEVLTRSTAAIHILDRLGGFWTIVGTLLRSIPRPLRDAAYDLVGRNRQRLFARPTDTCPRIPPALRARFIA